MPKLGYTQTSHWSGNRCWTIELGTWEKYWVDMLYSSIPSPITLSPPSINELAIVTIACPDWDYTCFPAGNGRHAGQEDCFLNPFVHRRTAVAHPEPTKAFPKQSPETAMLSAPFGCTHPPPPIPPFLLKQNLSLKVIAGSDVTR